MKNVIPINGGKVHKVTRMSKLTYAPKENGSLIGRICEPTHDPNETSGWFNKFVKTDKPITCGNCLQSYWPDGRKRV